MLVASWWTNAITALIFRRIWCNLLIKWRRNRWNIFLYLGAIIINIEPKNLIILYIKIFMSEINSQMIVISDWNTFPHLLIRYFFEKLSFVLDPCFKLSVFLQLNSLHPFLLILGLHCLHLQLRSKPVDPCEITTCSLICECLCLTHRIVTRLASVFPYTARDVLDGRGLRCLCVILHVGVKFRED